MPASAQYHVILDGQGYIVDVDKYLRSLSKPFAPKTRSGATTYGDLSLQAAWAQQDWRGGFGYPEYNATITNRFGDATGIDPSFGDVRLGRATSQVHAPGPTDIYALAVYQGNIYAISGASGAIYVSTDGGANWSTAFTAGPTSLKSIALYNGWLIVGSGSSGVLIKYDGTTWTDPWHTISGSPTAVRSMFAYTPAGTPYLFCGASLTASTSKLVRITAAPAETLIHLVKLPHIDAIYTHAGKLWYAGLEDTNGARGELWQHDGTNSTYIDQLTDNGITSFAEFNTELWAGSRTRGKLWTVTGAGLKQQFSIPEVAMSGSPPDYTKAIRAITVDGGKLFFPVVDAKGLGFYQFDGTGWVRIATAAIGTEPRGIIAFNQDIFFTSQDATGGRIYRATRTYPLTGELITSWFDADLGSIEKLFTRVTIAHAPLAANEAIAVAYALNDSATWTTLGTSDTDNETWATFTFPSATRGRRIRFRFTLTLTTQTATPKLRDVVLEFNLGLPGITGTGLKSEWDVTVLMEGDAQVPLIRLDQSAEPLSALALSNALWTTAAKNQSVSFTDMDAVVRTVYVNDVEESPARISDRITFSRRGRVRLLEA